MALTIGSATIGADSEGLEELYTKIHADIYIFVSGGDTEKSHLKLAVESIRGLTRDCFEGCEEKGCIISSGVTEMGDVSNKEVMTEAFYMGKNA